MMHWSTSKIQFYQTFSTKSFACCPELKLFELSANTNWLKIRSLYSWGVDRLIIFTRISRSPPCVNINEMRKIRRCICVYFMIKYDLDSTYIKNLNQASTLHYSNLTREIFRKLHPFEFHYVYYISMVSTYAFMPFLAFFLFFSSRSFSGIRANGESYEGIFSCSGVPCWRRLPSESALDEGGPTSRKRRSSGGHHRCRRCVQVRCRSPPCSSASFRPP